MKTYLLTAVLALLAITQVYAVPGKIIYPNHVKEVDFVLLKAPVDGVHYNGIVHKIKYRNKGSKKKHELVAASSKAIEIQWVHRGVPYRLLKVPSLKSFVYVKQEGPVNLLTYSTPGPTMPSVNSGFGSVQYTSHYVLLRPGGKGLHLDGGWPFIKMAKVVGLGTGVAKEHQGYDDLLQYFSDCPAIIEAMKAGKAPFLYDMETFLMRYNTGCGNQEPLPGTITLKGGTPQEVTFVPTIHNIQETLVYQDAQGKEHRVSPAAVEQVTFTRNYEKVQLRALPAHGEMPAMFGSQVAEGTVNMYATQVDWTLGAAGNFDPKGPVFLEKGGVVTAIPDGRNARWNALKAYFVDCAFIVSLLERDRIGYLDKVDRLVNAYNSSCQKQ